MTRALANSPWFVLLASALAWAGDEAAPTPAELEFFERRVRPILAENCYKCHGPQKQKSGLRVDSRARLLAGGESGPAVVPMRPDESELIKAIRYEADGFQMPPSAKLADEQIATLTEWVKMGAPWPGGTSDPETRPGQQPFNLAERARHWSFQPVRAAVPPAVSRVDWPRTPVDNFILAKLEGAELEPAQPADKEALLRRVTFDLVGLPPTPSERDNFLRDTSPGAYERVVERLLASPHYGERWGRHWLDLVRFAETSGHEFDYEILHAWPYRDYVIRALNDDLPYNRFVVEHIAGDMLDAPRRHPVTGLNESVVGTAFYWFGQGKHSPVDIRAEECDTIDNQIDVLGKAFLGLTIACARCHDHKFDPITSRDYYALAGFLQSSRQQHAALDDPEPRQRLAAQLAALNADGSRLLSPQNEDAVRSLAGAAIDALADLSAESPLLRAAAVAQRGESANEAESPRAKLHHELVEQARSAREWLERSVLFEDFTGPDFSNWFVTGDAFGEGPTRAIEFVPGNDPKQPVRQFVEPGVAHSGLVSPRWQGTLRSATFTIEKPYIFYRAARHDGQEKPVRASKVGQIHLIVDGFQIIKDPLYGGLSINLPRNAGWKWYRQDVGRFLGSRAYIEIADEDDGSIAVDQIVFSDDATALDAPGPLALALCDESAGAADANSSEQVRRQLLETAEAWRGGKLDALSSPAERVEMLNLMIRRGDLLAADGSNRAAEGTATVRPALATNDDRGTSRNELGDWFARRARLEAEIRPPRLAIAMTTGTPENEHLLPRGNHKKPAEAVPRRFLEVFTGASSAEQGRGPDRLELAERMIDPANPLLARVLVNRLWHHHFGRGLVSTPDDFGHMGQPPSHPELLDYLASELSRRGWSLKAMHRLMVLSSTYRMSSSATVARAEERDPQNALWHRMPLRRLEGEVLRDAMLALSGRLDRRMEGPGVPPHLTEFMEGRGRPAHSGPLDGNGRRSVYITVRRNFLTPLFLAFDFPTPFTTAGRRSVSNVPAQALTLMNNPFVVEQAALWSRRSCGAEATSAEECVRRLYAEAFCREPTDRELSAALELWKTARSSSPEKGDAQAWADLCHALWNVKEFTFIP